MSPLCAVVAIALAAPASEPIPAATHIVAVPDSDHVVVARGTRHHFPDDARGLAISPRRPATETRTTPPVEFGVVIARADVVRVDESTALLRLRDVVRAPSVGDHVAWSLELDPRRRWLHISPLLWLAALDIGAHTLDDERELISLADVLASRKSGRKDADLPAAWRHHGAVLHDMVAEIHRHADLAKKVYTDPIDRGPHRGRQLGDVFAGTTVHDVARFWEYVLSRPRHYMTWSRRFVEIYATWVLNGATSGLDFSNEPHLARRQVELGQALRQLRWARASQLLSELTRLHPEAERWRTDALAVQSIRRTEAALERDPDDDSAALVRARALASIGLYPPAITALEGLAARGYRTDEVALRLGFALCGASRWDACERHFDRLIAARDKRLEPDTTLEKWRAFARSHGTRGGNLAVGDAATQIATAQALESEGAWDAAVGSWRNAIIVARGGARPELLATARAGLARARQRLALSEEVKRGVDALQEHDIATARAVLAAALSMARALGEPEAAVRELAALARAAREVEERAFAGRVLEARVSELPPACAEACPARGSALADLAEHVAEGGDLARAEALFEESIKLAPRDIEARAKRAWFYAELGRWSDAFSVAFIAAPKSAAMSWVVVRASAARNRFDDALDVAGRLGRIAPSLGRIDAALHRLVDVAEALQRKGSMSPDRIARLLLRRIRALAELGLERVAWSELPALATFPALQREAAWAIARSPRPARLGIDLFAPSERLAAARLAASDNAARVRQRRLAELSARAGADPDAGAPHTALAVGDFHRAWALVRGTNRSDRRRLIQLAQRGLAARRLMERAARARERGDYETQRTLAVQARNHYQATRTPRGWLEATLSIARADFARHDREAAARHAAAGLEEARREGDPELVRAFEALLTRSRRSGSRDELERLLMRHLEQCERLDDDACQARTSHELALVMIERGRVSDAYRALERSVAGFEGLHRRAEARRATMAMVRVHRLRSELAQAAARAEQVLSAAVDDGDGLAERRALLELGSLALTRGDLESARSWLSSAREAAQRGRDERVLALAEATLGRAELRLGGDLRRSIEALDRAATRFRAIEEAGDALAAEIELAKALMRPPAAEASQRRARTLLTSAPALAESLGREVLQLEALLTSASAHLDSDENAAAEKLIDAAIKLAARVELDDMAALTDHLVARLELARGNRSAAADTALAAARRLAKPLLRGTLPAGMIETEAVFSQAADLLFEHGQHSDALEILELHRTATEPRAFDLGELRHAADPRLATELSRLAEARARAHAVDARLREDANLAPEERAQGARRELVALAARSKAELEPLVARLAEDHPAHYRALARDPQSLAQERRKLPPKTLLVEYFVGDSALFLFVIRPRAVRDAVTALRVTVGRQTIADTVRRYKQLVATDSRLAQDLSRSLHRWLVAPLGDVVPASERAETTVILLPHGPLFDVPFAALISTPPGEAPRFAIEHWRFVIASATTLTPLMSGRRRLAALGPVLGLTDPAGNLPEARRELDRLPDALDATILRGEEATAERLLSLSPAHRILHIATHSTISDDPGQSALLLASGALSVGRIANLEGLRGRVALVFLSACGSATEVRNGPHEAMSLAEGFALAGVPTLIGSLWDVDDRATRILVERFYRHLAEARLDTLGALRAAQIDTMRTVIDGRRPYADPRFWAAFELIGDYR